MKKTKYKIRKVFLLAIVYCSLSTVLTGCATVPPGSASAIKETIKIGGASYVPAQKLCAAYNLDYHWDPITKKVVMIKDEKVVKLLVDSPTVLVNDTVYTMDKEVKFYYGTVAIPQSFVYRTLTPLFRQEFREREILPRGTGLPIRTVIIDPGHGGRDPGAVGKRGLKEKDIVLDIARKLKNKLEATGVNVVLSRQDDSFISLEQRSKIANSRDADFFISLHANASRSRWVSGVEVFYLSEAIDESQRALQAATNYDLKLAEAYSGKYTAAILWDLIYSANRKSSIQLAGLVSACLSKELAQKNRGSKPARFYVLKGTNVPAILVEIGFISNPREESKLRNVSYRDEIAQGLLEGICQYNREFTQTRTVRY